MSRAESFVPTCWRMSAFFVTHWSSKLLGQVDDLLALGVVVGRDVGAGEVLVVVVDAVDRRRRVAGAPRVPADDVEVLEQLLVVAELGAGGERRPAEAGPAGVDEQRADPGVLVGRAVAHEEQLERPRGGVVVVDRHLQQAGVELVVELLPVDRTRRLRRVRLRRRSSPSVASDSDRVVGVVGGVRRDRGLGVLGRRRADLGGLLGPHVGASRARHGGHEQEHADCGRAPAAM